MMGIEEVAKELVDAAIHVHKALGPGLLESAYQQYLAHELRKRGLQVDYEVILPVVHDATVKSNLRALGAFAVKNIQSILIQGGYNEIHRSNDPPWSGDTPLAHV